MSVPPVFNPDIHKQLQPKQQRNIAYYIDGIKTGNRYILSESITLLESSVPDKRALGTGFSTILKMTTLLPYG